MSKTKIKIDKASPIILSLLGAVGVIGTAVTAVKVTPKALAQLEEKKQKLKTEELSVQETVTTVWKTYIPTAALAFGTIACIFGVGLLEKHQQAALTSAYALISNSYNAYKDKLKELYGEEAHETIMKSVVKENCRDVHISTAGLASVDTLEFYPETESEVVRTFYDAFSDRHFESTIERVLQAEYHLNRNFTLAGEASVNEFYDFLGLDEIEGGDEKGWDTSSGMGWVDFSHYTVTLDDGMEILVIEMIFEPEVLDLS